jgi:alcohol dehydrogenase class IV
LCGAIPSPTATRSENDRADGLAEFGVTEDRIDELAERTLGMERLLSRNARRMTRDDIEQVLQRAL